MLYWNISLLTFKERDKVLNILESTDIMYISIVNISITV